MPYSLHKVLRVCLSVGIVILSLAAGAQMRHVNTTTMALVLVLAILGISVKWGGLEALIAAGVAGFGLDYFFLPPRGFGIGDLQHWVALLAFLVTALVSGQLSARAKRNLAEAIRSREEIEKLYRVAAALAEGENADDIIKRLGSSLAEVFGLEAVVLRGPQEGPQDADLIVASGQAWGSRGGRASATLRKALADRLGAAIGKANVAEKERELAAARRSEELKSAIFDAWAHEAKGPLSSIKVAASALLSEHSGDAAQQRELLTIIGEEVDRVSGWIDEAEQLRGTDASRLAANQTPRDVKGLVSSAIQELGAMTGSWRIQVEMPESLPMARCDAGMIRRVLNLLLDNALKYSAASSPVTVSASLDYDADMVVVGVADAGPGVPEEEQVRVFEKHYRCCQQSSRIPGTGLGLASAKCMVEAQGGEIWVTNRPEGGAAFHFSLPVAMRATT